MAIKFSQVFTRGDRIRIGILLIVAGIAWLVVFREYKKPFDINWPEPQVVFGELNVE